MYNPGYTETEPYSYRFAWFGFDSVNYVLALGFTINFFIVLIAVKSLLAFLIKNSIGKQESWFIH